jgi:glycine cleavage system H lipoate-binding protein
VVPVLVLLTFAACLAFHRLVIRKGYLDERSGWPAKLASGSPSCPCQIVPDGVYLQPTYTWSRVGISGAVYVGLHPALLSLLGPEAEVEVRAAGDRVEKGDVLASLGRSGLRLTVRSPISGRVSRVNRRVVHGEPRWDEVEAGGAPWLYQVWSENVADETPRWLTGRRALEWARHRSEEVRSFLLEACPAGGLGAVMADGGDLPTGILGAMDQGVWHRFEERFLAPLEGAAAGAADPLHPLHQE